MTTEVDDVAWFLEVAANCGATPIVAGGWGVDALAGRQTRDHRDLDLLVQHECVESIAEELCEAGFVVSTDWLPVRIELSDAVDDRRVDVHPIHDDGHGGWWQHGLDGQIHDYPAHALTTGAIGGVVVSCLTVAKQRHLHTGYELRRDDVHDLAVLDGLEPP
ncbi:MAG: hypothetical protein QNJ12_23390 [Ilumatobacter sp.]|uniref:nucleotidyltransferase domain-containing protein n=1 Tax=Ilumatobacter sp. TaxID=1967498 RepID=UPI00261B55E8|nr:hypothetical protein [Ilumatobacter sp.]MDJ0771750.1 hypothetical protein [Ilumatobacter sp.]